MLSPKYTVTARANHRIELAGDWGDLPDFCQRYGAKMINMAIAIPDLIIEVRGSKIDRPVVEIISLDGNASEIIATAEQLTHNVPPHPLFLPKAVVNDCLRCSDPPGDLATLLLARFGTGIKIVTNSTAPAGSGLGTSSILAAAMRCVISHLLGEPLDPAEACWQTFLMETSLGLGSGWQDQIGGILSGIKEIQDDMTGQLKIRALTPPAVFLDTMADLTVLAYTGRTRYSGEILNGVCEGLKQERPMVEVVQALQAFCDPVKAAITTGDYPTLGRFANQITELEKQLHPAIVPPHVQQVFADASPYCYGSRICGAGGEGFLVFFTKGDKEKTSVIQLLGKSELTFYSMRLGSGLTIDIGSDEILTTIHA